MKLSKFTIQRFVVISLFSFVLTIGACATIPEETVELSNTVGRDLEEVHRSHRALAALLFDSMERDVNRFIREIYAPAYIKAFAMDYRLDDKVKGIVANAPNNLLPVLVRFVEKCNEIIENKRGELLSQIKAQRDQVIDDIDASYRQLQAAQALIAGHLASVRKVHDAQNEGLRNAGLEGMRERLAENTGEVSNRIGDLIDEAEKADGELDKVEGILLKIKETINSIKPKEESND
jgi:hypothetical protein